MRIAVVGAGIGGLVAAAGLQADGHEVLVYERREDAGAIGAGLTLFPNAFAALDAIGLGDPVREISSDELSRLRSGHRRPSGVWLLTLPATGAPAVRSLHRADLHRTLAERLAAGSLRTGCPVAVAPDGAPLLRVGDEQERFELVIAADGIRSEARTRWGLDRGLRSAGYTAWRGVTGPLPRPLEAAGESWGAGARFGIVPLPGGRVYWFATRSMPAGAPDPDPHGTLRELFGRWHAPIDELLAATPAEAVLRHDIFDLAAIPPSFVHGRGVLLGDAAHAMTPDLGQGAGQAVEDAAALVLLLRGCRPEGLRAALERYDRLRRRRAAELWRRSRLAGRIGQARGPARLLRDAALRAVPGSFLAASMTRLQAWAPPGRPGFSTAA